MFPSFIFQASSFQLPANQRQQPCKCPSAASTRSSCSAVSSGQSKVCQLIFKPSPGIYHVLAPARPLETSWVGAGASKVTFRSSWDWSPARPGSSYSCWLVSSWSRFNNDQLEKKNHCKYFVNRGFSVQAKILQRTGQTVQNISWKKFEVTHRSW